MVDYEIAIKKTDLLKTLKEAGEYAKTQIGEPSKFIINGGGAKLEIQDDFFMANMDDGSWIAVMPEDFKPEFIEFLFEVNAGLATEEVLQAFLKAAGIE